MSKHSKPVTWMMHDWGNLPDITDTDLDTAAACHKMLSTSTPNTANGCCKQVQVAQRVNVPKKHPQVRDQPLKRGPHPHFTRQRLQPNSQKQHPSNHPHNPAPNQSDQPRRSPRPKGQAYPYVAQTLTQHKPHKGQGKTAMANPNTRNQGTGHLNSKVGENPTSATQTKNEQSTCGSCTHYSGTRVLRHAAAGTGWNGGCRFHYTWPVHAPQNQVPFGVP